MGRSAGHLRTKIVDANYICILLRKIMVWTQILSVYLHMKRPKMSWCARGFGKTRPQQGPQPPTRSIYSDITTTIEKFCKNGRTLLHVSKHNVSFGYISKNIRRMKSSTEPKKPCFKYLSSFVETQEEVKPRKALERKIKKLKCE